MVQFTDLRVFKEARQNIRDIAAICERNKGFGDLHNQLKRASISVVSNIAEGAGSGTRKQNIKFLMLVAAPEGVEVIKSSHPDVVMFTASLDERLNEKSYIVPGLGDAGDRIFDTL